MKTNHRVLISDSRNLNEIKDNSVDLVVTSPPYPMIQMWDDLFSDLSSKIKIALDNNDGDTAFEAMHLELDKTWKEIERVTKDGAFVCINIGDATRTIDGHFQLYSNHSRIIRSFKKLGFTTLPNILWRKQTNAPNKFMGSGMLPSGAYVTLEHEYILIFRKGNKRLFKTPDLKNKRMESAYFWEERNQWFSDIWELKGIKQSLNHKKLRERSAAYPFELAYRLVNMYSQYGDTVLDPFLGTGTTTYACMASGRNSIGVEIDSEFTDIIINDEISLIDFLNNRIKNRIIAHKNFIEEYINRGKSLKHINIYYDFPVMTKQETKIKLQNITDIIMKENLLFEVTANSI